jgi:hypothetical protein
MLISRQGSGPKWKIIHEEQSGSRRILVYVKKTISRWKGSDRNIRPFLYTSVLGITICKNSIGDMAEGARTATDLSNLKSRKDEWTKVKYKTYQSREDGEPKQ